MTEERLKLWLGFAKFILGTVVLGLVTTFVNHTLQKRELELKEQEQVAQFLQHALQEDVGVRHRFAQYFSTVTRSDELRRGWAEYYRQVDAEFTEKEKEKATLEAKVQQEGLDAKERERLNSRIADLDQALSPKPAVAQLDIDPRVYFHIRDAQQFDAAKRLAGTLSENSFGVPGIERLDKGPTTSELRYFRRKEKDEAEAIAALIREKGSIPISVTYVPGYELSTGIRPRHYEAWFAADALKSKRE